MRETCWCGHSEEDHNGINCYGIWYDDDLPIGCRCKCSGHFDNSEATWLSYRTLHLEVLKDEAHNHSFWNRIKAWWYKSHHI